MAQGSHHRKPKYYPNHQENAATSVKADKMCALASRPSIMSRASTGTVVWWDPRSCKEGFPAEELSGDHSPESQQTRSSSQMLSVGSLHFTVLNSGNARKAEFLRAKNACFFMTRLIIYLSLPHVGGNLEMTICCSKEKLQQNALQIIK